MGLGELSPWHLLILALVVLVLFGAKRLPDSARSLGRAMRIFKAETAGLRADGKTDEPASPPAQPAPPQQLSAPPPAQAQPGMATGAPAQEAPRTNQPG